MKSPLRENRTAGSVRGVILSLFYILRRMKCLLDKIRLSVLLAAAGW
jgi:hypothetical protein